MARSRTARLKRELKLHLADPSMVMPQLKTFKAKNPHIPKLESYHTPAPDSWWDLWPKLSWEEGQHIKSAINPRRPMVWADKADDPEVG